MRPTFIVLFDFFPINPVCSNFRFILSLDFTILMSKENQARTNLPSIDRCGRVGGVSSIASSEEYRKDLFLDPSATSVLNYSFEILFLQLFVINKLDCPKRPRLLTGSCLKRVSYTIEIIKREL